MSRIEPLENSCIVLVNCMVLYSSSISCGWQVIIGIEIWLLDNFLSCAPRAGNAIIMYVNTYFHVTISYSDSV